MQLAVGLVIRDDAGEDLCLLGVRFGLFHAAEEVGIFKILQRRTVTKLQARYDVIHRNQVIIGDIEHAILFRGPGKEYHRLCRFVDGRELHLSLQKRVRASTQYPVRLQAPHGGVGVEVYLEFSVGSTRRQITCTHYLCVQLASGHIFEYVTLGHELGEHVLVVGVLPEVQHLLREHRRFASGHSADTLGGYLNQHCTALDTEIDDILHALVIDLQNVVPA